MYLHLINVDQFINVFFLRLEHRFYAQLGYRLVSEYLDGIFLFKQAIELSEMYKW